MNTEDIRKASLPACRKFDVRRLDVFGSTARDVASGTSDVDLLVEFRGIRIVVVRDDSSGFSINWKTPWVARSIYSLPPVSETHTSESAS